MKIACQIRECNNQASRFLDFQGDRFWFCSAHHSLVADGKLDITGIEPWPEAEKTAVEAELYRDSRGY